VVPPYLKMLLPEANIVLDEDLRIAAIQRDGQREDFDVLSGGTKEQLAVLMRLAFAELLVGQGRPATVILDGALAFSDDDRIETMFDILMRAGDKVQIIVLTCRKWQRTCVGSLSRVFRHGGPDDGSGNCSRAFRRIEADRARRRGRLPAGPDPAGGIATLVLEHCTSVLSTPT
jgi:hypothetical protein